jgi:hypothetical protein
LTGSPAAAVSQPGPVPEKRLSAQPAPQTAENEAHLIIDSRQPRGEKLAALWSLHEKSKSDAERRVFLDAIAVLKPGGAELDRLIDLAKSDRAPEAVRVGALCGLSTAYTRPGRSPGQVPSTEQRAANERIVRTLKDLSTSASLPVSREAVLGFSRLGPPEEVTAVLEEAYRAKRLDAKQFSTELAINLPGVPANQLGPTLQRIRAVSRDLGPSEPMLWANVFSTFASPNTVRSLAPEVTQSLLEMAQMVASNTPSADLRGDAQDWLPAQAARVSMQARLSTGGERADVLQTLYRQYVERDDASAVETLAALISPYGEELARRAASEGRIQALEAKLQLLKVNPGSGADMALQEATARLKAASDGRR